MGEFAQLLDGVLNRDAQSVEHLDGGLGIFSDDVLGETKIDGERDEVLLCSVVQISLDPAPLGVAARDDARS